MSVYCLKKNQNTREALFSDDVEVNVVYENSLSILSSSIALFTLILLSAENISMMIRKEVSSVQ